MQKNGEEIEGMKGRRIRKEKIFKREPQKIIA